MKTKAIYPGTFDPVTYGHMDIIKRAAKVFDEVIVSVAHNPDKKPLFTTKERIAMLKEAVFGIDNIVIDDFGVLLVEYAKSKGAKVIIRGLRAVSDFEFEFQMALMNKKIAEDIETVFMMPRDTYTYLSSRIIKEIIKLDGKIEQFVPKHVVQCLKEKFKIND